jgi:hypothetical protein
MQLLTAESRALLIQDSHDYLVILRHELGKLGDQITAEGLSEQSVLDWIVKESIERVYCLFTVNHDSRCWMYRRIFDQVANEVDLCKLIGQYIQVPKLFGDCYIDLEIRGIDLYLWYFSHYRTPATANYSYSYQRKWN